MPKKTIILNEEEVINDYVSSVISVDALAKKYCVGKIKIRKILESHGVERRKRGGQSNPEEYKVSDWRIEKYPTCDGFHYVAIAKDDDSFATNDYMNLGGVLTSYISQKMGVEVPNLHFRRKYYQTTGDYWWEQYFNIIKVANEKTKKCPYCDWETIDINNKSGSFSNHILRTHGISVEEHLKNYPDDILYFAEANKIKERREFLSKQDNYIVCPICSERMKIITETHLRNKHGISMGEFKRQYPLFNITSHATSEKLKMCIYKGNLNVSKKRFVSKYEKEIQEFLSSNGIIFETNRQILDGREIDILIEDKKIGIEFDGLYWHSEYGNKDHCYHLNKTKVCNAHGYKLIHIFEDEYVNHKELVLKKISHILGINEELPKIPGRKITVKEIYKHDAEVFLNSYHIQGFIPSTVYIGGFFNGELVAVMTFRNKNMRNPNWELVRFATCDKYIYQGVGGKLFSYFVRNYNPDIVVSFADKRWTTDKTNNLYTKLGFTLDCETKPSYYYFGKSKGIERIHKFNFRKQVLSKRYGFPMTMTETEMADALGYKKIWDCGLFKYVWYANKKLVEDEVHE